VVLGGCVMVHPPPIKTFTESLMVLLERNTLIEQLSVVTVLNSPAGLYAVLATSGSAFPSRGLL